MNNMDFWMSGLGIFAMTFMVFQAVFGTKEDAARQAIIDNVILRFISMGMTRQAARRLTNTYLDTHDFVTDAEAFRIVYNKAKFNKAFRPDHFQSGKLPQDILAYYAHTGVQRFQDVKFYTTA